MTTKKPTRAMNYIKSEIISLKNSTTHNEKWLQARIEEDPTILGLGDLDFRNTEKILPGGGRLDTILYDPEYKKLYEVEIQLGKTDESHIIRTIEYWDIERKKNPQYEHCAVIIAEDVTSRFLNIISLFNGFIPLIAIQVKAVKIENNISLFFTKVLDENKFDIFEESRDAEPTDKEYWIKKATQGTVSLVDKIISSLAEPVEGYSLKYNKHYIGIAKDNNANNFISFIPRKTFVLFSVKLEQSEEVDKLIESSSLDTMAYDRQWNQYRLRLKESDISNNLKTLKDLTLQAKEVYMR